VRNNHDHAAFSSFQRHAFPARGFRFGSSGPSCGLCRFASARAIWIQGHFRSDFGTWPCSISSKHSLVIRDCAISWSTLRCPVWPPVGNENLARYVGRARFRIKDPAQLAFMPVTYCYFVNKGSILLFEDERKVPWCDNCRKAEQLRIGICCPVCAPVQHSLVRPYLGRTMRRMPSRPTISTLVPAGTGSIPLSALAFQSTPRMRI